MLFLELARRPSTWSVPAT